MSYEEAVEFLHSDRITHSDIRTCERSTHKQVNVTAVQYTQGKLPFEKQGGKGTTKEMYYNQYSRLLFSCIRDARIEGVFASPPLKPLTGQLGSLMPSC